MSNSFVDSVDRAIRHGLACGALRPIQTFEARVPAGAVTFVIRVASTLVAKDQARVAAAAAGPPRNPFLPHDPDLFVTDISATHFCVLNKFNVLARHVLVVTRQFEHQETLLTEADFAAWWWCLGQAEGLGFYNSGAIAGASQPHKHLQWVGLPLSESGEPIPVEPLFAMEAGEGPRQLEQYPPAHRWAPLRFTPGRTENVAARLHAFYLDMLREANLAPGTGDPHPGGAYNLLLTRRWMLLVPRTRECFARVSVNGLAFAGSFFVRTEEDLRQIQTSGPWTVLKTVSGYGHPWLS